MKLVKREMVLAMIGVGLSFSLLNGCGEKEVVKTPPTKAELETLCAQVTPVAPDVLAIVDGQQITTADIKPVGGNKLVQAELDLYEAKKDALDQLIEDRVLAAAAKKENTTVDQLVKKNVNDKVKVDDKEVEKFYNDKKDQLKDKTLEEMKPKIRNFITQDKSQKLYSDMINNYRSGVKVEYKIKAPRVEVSEGEDNPSVGPKDAVVKMIEFTDYQCPFCGRARETINKVLETYKGKVRYTLRDFPLSFHKDSPKAHEAAHCAGEQGKYWDYNKVLFANQKDLKLEDLKKYAGEVKLNQKKFDECLDSGKFASKVSGNQGAGEKVGVTGTPAFFINGRMISGARPFESFKQIIDDELRSQ